MINVGRKRIGDCPYFPSGLNSCALVLYYSYNGATDWTPVSNERLDLQRHQISGSIPALSTATYFAIAANPDGPCVDNAVAGWEAYE